MMGTPGHAAPRGGGSGRGAQPLLLVVDDDPDILEVMGEALVNRGYRVATAENGQEALKRIAGEEPQLILLDMRMPVMDGATFAKVLRKRYGHQIPVVVVTAAEDAASCAAEVDAERHLEKPFDLEALYDVVSEVVSEQRGR